MSRVPCPVSRGEEDEGKGEHEGEVERGTRAGAGRGLGAGLNLITYLDPTLVLFFSRPCPVYHRAMISTFDATKINKNKNKKEPWETCEKHLTQTQCQRQYQCQSAKEMGGVGVRG